MNTKNLHKKVHYRVKICKLYTNCGVFSVNSFRLDRIGIKLSEYTKIYTKINTTV